MDSSIRRLAFGAGALAAVVSAPPLLAGPVDPSALYVFGDSLSDTGNVAAASGHVIPPPMSYADGRFSNGPLWIETVAGSLGIPTLRPYHGGVDPTDRGISFAYAGEGAGLSQVNPGGIPVPGLLGQVRLFNDLFGGAGGAPVPGSADPDALYVIWSSGNDYLLAGAGPPTSGFVPDPGVVTANIGTAVEELHEAGARRFLVLNLPNLGDVPFARMGPPGTVGALNAATAAHNAALQSVLGGLAAAHADISLHLFDVHDLVARMVASPEDFGFTTGVVAGPAAGCLFPPFACPDFSASFDSAGQGLLFWDELHPTAEAHRRIAQEALASLDVAEPRQIASFAFGLGVLGFLTMPAAVRRRARRPRTRAR